MLAEQGVHTDIDSFRSSNKCRFLLFIQIVQKYAQAK